MPSEEFSSLPRKHGWICIVKSNADVLLKRYYLNVLILMNLFLVCCIKSLCVRIHNLNNKTVECQYPGEVNCL